MKKAGKMIDETNNDRRVTAIGEAAVARVLLKENPVFHQLNSLTARGFWLFEKSPPGKVLQARLAYFRNEPVPCKDLVASLRELKYSVRLKLEGPR